MHRTPIGMIGWQGCQEWMADTEVGRAAAVRGGDFMKKHDKKLIDRIWKRAIEYITKDGWPTRKIDEAIADRIYLRWLRETQETWSMSGQRDRDLLRDALEETFSQHYGEEGGEARLIIFSLLLECRMRREGHVKERSELWRQ